MQQLPIFGPTLSGLCAAPAVEWITRPHERDGVVGAVRFRPRLLPFAGQFGLVRRLQIHSPLERGPAAAPLQFPARGFPARNRPARNRPARNRPRSAPARGDDAGPCEVSVPHTPREASLLQVVQGAGLGLLTHVYGFPAEQVWCFAIADAFGVARTLRRDLPIGPRSPLSLKVVDDPGWSLLAALVGEN